MVAVVGADGFIGSMIVNKLKELHVDYIPVVFESNGEGIAFQDFLTNGVLNHLQSMIIVAGNSNHNLARTNFKDAVEKDTSFLFELDRYDWDTNVIFLSSAAVYYGYCGEVTEDNLIEPDDPYGVSKMCAEQIMKLIMKKRSGKLLIFRLTNAFGVSNRKRRLFDNILYSLRNNEVLTIYGNGTSYINPIRVETVADIIIKCSAKFDKLVSRKLEIVNLGSSQHVRVIDIANFLERKFGLRWKTDGTEIAPVKFKVSTERLRNLCKELEIELRNVYDEIEEFIREYLSINVS